MFADLHLHTRYSDGTYTSGDLVAAASGHGLALISLTDHDTLEGCAEVEAEAAKAGIRFISGTEVTAELFGRELHILGYLVDSASEPLARELERAQGIRQNRVRQMVARLQSQGIPLEAEAVFEMAKCNAPGRPHVARALVQAGHCGSLDEAFERFLKKDRPGWVPKEKMPAAKAIELIHGAHGLAVLAHPGLNHDDSLIAKLKDFGLDGLECFHPKHGGGATAKYQAIARDLGLLVTGGSDCHGRSKNRPTMGSVKLPMSFVDTLLDYQRNRPSSPAPTGGPHGSHPRPAS
ncbi:MAG: PHP domain-containing protein [Verrucomicrobiales bacterium]|nr:PHP domain-containing protein [Verrucomicrobiales bacterium]